MGQVGTGWSTWDKLDKERGFPILSGTGWDWVFFGIIPDSNQRPHAFQGASLPSELSMFNIHRLKIELVVCKCITYFTLIYFRTELLTRVKFSCHVLPGFGGPTGDGKWSHHKSLSILSSEIL